jgi:hypothetical protein
MIDRWNRWARDHGGARPEQVERPKVEAESPRDPWVWTICTNPKLEPIGKWEGKKHQ